jgi:hypothetical protein
MTVTSTALFRGAATTDSTTVLYTVPSGKKSVITNIAITNAGSSDATFTIKLDGIFLASATAISANSIASFDLKQVLDASKVVVGGASTGDVKFHISGVVIE